MKRYGIHDKGYGICDTGYAIPGKGFSDRASRISHRLSVLLLCFTLAISQASGQVAWNKQGGVAFRIDDNHDMWQFNSFDSLFSIYGYKFSTALILEDAAFNPGYMAELTQLYAKGHEYMDHTPSHSTCKIQLSIMADTSFYHGNPYVDHINLNRVCFKWESVDTTTVQGEGLVNVFNNLVISVLPGEFSTFYDPVYIPMLFLPLTNQIHTWTNLQNVNPLDPDSLTLRSFWEEEVNLNIHLGIPYHRLTSFDVTMPDDVLLMLGERDLALCETWGITPPVNWIQPFGSFPLLHRSDVSRTYGNQLGYIGGATYQNESFKTYNEYNPDNDKQFAMMFWDFSTTHLTAKENKELIANGIAKHLLLIDQNHFMPSTPTWNGFLERTDSLLSWLYANNIPVLTQRQWVPMLFDSVNNPFVNIFPLLQTDLNEDLIPDGYELEQGIMIYTDGVAQSNNRSVQMTGTGTFFRIKGLGGLEKGTNNFSFYTKGNPGNVIWLRLYFPETGSGDIFPFTVDQSGWAQHTIPIAIPQNVSVVNIELECQTYAGGELRISGMELRGIAEPIVAQESVSVMTNRQFPIIALDTLVWDPNYPLQQLTIIADSPGVLEYDLDTLAGTLWVYKPSSFWTGTDSLKITAVNPEGGVGSGWQTFTAIPADICKGQAITIYPLNPPSGATFFWTAIPPDPSLVQPTVSNPTVSPQQNTFYTVFVTAPGQSYNESLVVTVHLLENITLYGPLPAYCSNASPVQLFGDPPGGFFSGPGVAGDMFYPVFADTGPNTLRYTMIEPGGCEGEDTLVVTIQPIPQLFLPTDSIVCHWQTILLDAGLGYDTYLWSTGATTSSVLVNAEGMSADSIRQITLIVTKNGCAGFDTTIVHFKACTGIDSRMPDAGCLIVYPNPVSTILIIDYDCSGKFISGTNISGKGGGLTPGRESITGSIIDLLGNEVMTFQINPGKNTLDIRTIPSGVYILSFKGEGIAVVTRVVKLP